MTTIDTKTLEIVNTLRKLDTVTQSDIKTEVERYYSPIVAKRVIREVESLIPFELGVIICASD